MDDIFFFTPSRIGPQEVIESAQGVNVLQSVSVSPLGDQFNLVLGEGELTTWYVEPVAAEAPGLSPEERRMLRRAGLEVGFVIAHHRTALPQLIPLLSSLIEEYGGWVGNDDDFFEPRFSSAKELDNFRYSP